MSAPASPGGRRRREGDRIRAHDEQARPRSCAIAAAWSRSSRHAEEVRVLDHDARGRARSPPCGALEVRRRRPPSGDARSASRGPCAVRLDDLRGTAGDSAPDTTIASALRHACGHQRRLGQRRARRRTSTRSRRPCPVSSQIMRLVLEDRPAACPGSTSGWYGV